MRFYNLFIFCFICVISQNSKFFCYCDTGSGLGIDNDQSGSPTGLTSLTPKSSDPNSKPASETDPNSTDPNQDQTNESQSPTNSNTYTKVDLDLLVKETTDQFWYYKNKQTGFEFYLCKRGFVFKDVKESVGSKCLDYLASLTSTTDSIANVTTKTQPAIEGPSKATQGQSNELHEGSSDNPPNNLKVSSNDYSASDQCVTNAIWAATGGSTTDLLAYYVVIGSTNKVHKTATLYFTDNTIKRFHKTKHYGQWIEKPLSVDQQVEQLDLNSLYDNVGKFLSSGEDRQPITLSSQQVSETSEQAEPVQQGSTGESRESTESSDSSGTPEFASKTDPNEQKSSVRSAEDDKESGDGSASATSSDPNEPQVSSPPAEGAQGGGKEGQKEEDGSGTSSAEPASTDPDQVAEEKTPDSGDGSGATPEAGQSAESHGTDGTKKEGEDESKSPDQSPEGTATTADQDSSGASAEADGTSGAVPSSTDPDASGTPADGGMAGSSGSSESSEGTGQSGSAETDGTSASAGTEAPDSGSSSKDKSGEGTTPDPNEPDSSSTAPLTGSSESGSTDQDGTSTLTGGQQGEGSSAPAQQPDGASGSSGSTDADGSGTSGTDQDQSSGAPIATTTPDSSKPVKLTGVELSLKAKEGTNQFDYKKDGKTVTYTAKQGFGFSAVKTKSTSGGCSSCCGSSCCGAKTSGVTIWETKDATEYATKVVLNGKGQKTKTVTIHLPNDKKKSYYRPEKNQPWVEGTGPSSASGDKSKSSSSSGSEFELNIKSDAKSNENYEIKEAYGDAKIFNIKPGKNCTVVKCDDKEVWKYEVSKESMGYPTSVKHKENIIIITLTNGYLKYDKKDDKWEKDENASTKEPSSSTTTGGATGTGGGGTTGTGGSDSNGTSGGGTQGGTTPDGSGGGTGGGDGGTGKGTGGSGTTPGSRPSGGQGGTTGTDGSGTGARSSSGGTGTKSR